MLRNGVSKRNEIEGARAMLEAGATVEEVAEFEVGEAMVPPEDFPILSANVSARCINNLEFTKRIIPATCMLCNHGSAAQDRGHVAADACSAGFWHSSMNMHLEKFWLIRRSAIRNRWRTPSRRLITRRIATRRRSKCSMC